MNILFISTVPPNYPWTMGINCEGQINAIAMNKDSSMAVVAGRTGKFLIEMNHCLLRNSTEEKRKAW